MRWKFLVFASIIAGLLSVALWSMFAIIIFGSARVLAQEDWRLIVSLVIPLGLTTASGVFVYRHTSRRRKTQMAFTFVLTLVLSIGFYLISSQVLPDKLIIPRKREVRQAR